MAQPAAPQMADAGHLSGPAQCATPLTSPRCWPCWTPKPSSCQAVNCNGQVCLVLLDYRSSAAGAALMDMEHVAHREARYVVRLSIGSCSRNATRMCPGAVHDSSLADEEPGISFVSLSEMRFALLFVVSTGKHQEAQAVLLMPARLCLKRQPTCTACSAESSSLRSLARSCLEATCACPAASTCSARSRMPVASLRVRRACTQDVVTTLADL